MEDGMLICSICGEPTEDRLGNNAYPVNHGRCCNACNDVYVVPARMRVMMGVSTKEQEYKEPACDLQQQAKYLEELN